MAGIEIKVDGARAIAKISALPPAVRNNLRQLLPSIVTTLGLSVEDKLSSELKSRSRLHVKKQMVENPLSISGVVGITADPGPSMLPEWLEYGTRPHMIEAKNAKALHFHWDLLGQDVFFKRVHHPGMGPYRFLERSLDEMRIDIIDEIERSVRGATRKIAA
jgi:hypothetical protein